MNTVKSSQLGKSSLYVDQYDPSILFPIPRYSKRVEIGIEGAPIFFGADMWSAFELSWLNSRGKPQIALAHMIVPCESTNIIESKSLKLYLNSFNNTIFENIQVLSDTLRNDLNEALWRDSPAQKKGSIGLNFLMPEDFDKEPIHELDGLNLDRLDIDCSRYTPAPEFLRISEEEYPVNEVLTSNLLKSNWPGHRAA